MRSYCLSVTELLTKARELLAAGSAVQVLESDRKAPQLIALVVEPPAGRHGVGERLEPQSHLVEAGKVLEYRV